MAKIDFYTDGSCIGNPGKGGWAYVLVVDDVHFTSKTEGQKYATNNQMELMAVMQALLTARAYPRFSKCTIYTDSNYVKQGITSWIHNWKRNGWKTADGKNVKNKDYWTYIDELCKDLDVTWKWVKAHNGNKWNEEADRLANNSAKEI